MTTRETSSRQAMKLNILLFLSIAAVLTSCNGQNASQITNNSFSGHNSPVSINDTVTEIDKNIWIVFQDKHNNYWFGSDGQGVYRYDGKTILHFSTKDGLLNNRIRGIQEDKSGNVFITSLKGINKFDGQKFTTLPVIESNEWKLDPNDLWFYCDFPYRYDGKSLYRLKFPKHHMEDEFYAANRNHPWSPYDVYTIYKDTKGNLWFGTSNFGICRYNGKSLSWMYEEHLTLVEGGGSFGIRSIIEDKEGNFWFCNTRYRYDIFPNDSISQGYNFINYKKEKGIDFSETNRGSDLIYYQCIVEDNKRNLWMSTYTGGVWQYDGENMTHYPLKDGSEDIKIISIYRDNHGDLWLGTQEEGVYKFNGKTFEKFKA